MVSSYDLYAKKSHNVLNELNMQFNLSVKQLKLMFQINFIKKLNYNSKA